MYDWVPKGHFVWLVIDTVEQLAVPDLVARLVPPRRSPRGRRGYDPVMLLTLLVYSYCCGVLTSRKIEGRCRLDASFRLACAGLVPDNSTIARFRRRVAGQPGLMAELLYGVLAVCAAAGLGRLTVVAGDGVKITANASREANRGEAGLRKLQAAEQQRLRELAGQIAGQAEQAELDGERDGTAGPGDGTGPDLLGGEELGRDWADPRSRLGRIRQCLDSLVTARQAAQAAQDQQARQYLDAQAAGELVRKPPAGAALAAARYALAAARREQQDKISQWERARAQGRKAGGKPAPVESAKMVRVQRERLERLQAREQARSGAAGQAGDGKKKEPVPVRNITDPDSALMPVRGGGFRQGYNCQDAATDDRLFLGGLAGNRTTDVSYAADLEQLAVKGAAVVAAAHAAARHDITACHARMCTSSDRRDPGHDTAACHTAMTSRIGVLVEDAGYFSEANITSALTDKLIATGKHASLARAARDNPAAGPPPPDAAITTQMDHRLRTPQGRAAYRRRAPDIEGVHSSLEEIIGLRRFTMRGLAHVTGEFLLAGICHNLLLLSRTA